MLCGHRRVRRPHAIIVPVPCLYMALYLSVQDTHLYLLTPSTQHAGHLYFRHNHIALEIHILYFVEKRYAMFVLKK